MSFQPITCIDPGGGGGGGGDRGSGPPGKSQMAICFLRNPGTERPREAIGPIGSNYISMGPIAS